ncbi:MAG: sulfatase [Acidobacteriota bacterium]|nr:sulfatase [Acidobacteriota bacterium]
MFDLRTACLVLALSLVACGPRETVPEGKADGPPNIVILFADDLGYGDLGSYGHPSIRTPNLDRMAREGQRWTDFYVMAPVCSPSRGALLTGRLPVRTGLYGRRIPVFFPDEEGGIPSSETTLAEVLGGVGYDTAIFGKWHLGDRPHAYPTRHGFDRWIGLPYSNDMRWGDGVSFDEVLRMTADGRGEELSAIRTRRRGWYRQPETGTWNVPLISSRRTADGFEDEILEQPANQPLLTRGATEAAVEFIREHAGAGRPFFVYMPFSMPHTPIFRSPEFEGRSLADRYGDVIEEIDWSAGEVRRALEDSGLAHNTLVVFSSDNGPWRTMERHAGSAGLLRDGKGTTFEGGMRVPGIFWGAGVEPAVVSAIGTTMDVFATAVAAAGAELPAGTTIDGVDLAAVLRGDTSSAREALPYFRGGSLMAYRQGRYKIHFETFGAYGLPPEREAHDPPLLYDLAMDPGERVDLSAERPEVITELVAAARALEASFEPEEPLFDRRLQR